MGEDGLVSSANISAALLGMDGAMDDIPLFSPSGVQAFRAYHCRKRQMLVSLETTGPGGTGDRPRGTTGPTLGVNPRFGAENNL